MAALHTTRAATRAPRRALPRRRALCNRVVPDPTGITLEAGLLQVVRGLRTAEVESRQSGPQSLGLDPCTVTVTFNITADGTNRNQIVLDASVKPTIGVAPAGFGGAGYEREHSYTRFPHRPQVVLAREPAPG
jgi:hypothetical protein